MMSDRYGDRLNVFVEGCIRIHREYIESMFNHVRPDAFKVNSGTRYDKIVRVCDGGGESVHCFVDKKNGDVLKAASWRQPARHARGNVFDDDYGLTRMRFYGPEYLR